MSRNNKENFEFDTCASCTDRATRQFDVRLPSALLVNTMEECAERVISDTLSTDNAFARVGLARKQYSERKNAKKFLKGHPECNMTEEIVEGLMTDAYTFYTERGFPETPEL